MKFIIRLHAEITIKSKSVRKRYGKILGNNLRSLLRDIDATVAVRWLWDRIEVTLSDMNGHSDAVRAQMFEELQCVPGVSWFSEVIETPLAPFAELLPMLLDEWREQLSGKSFAVRVRRKGQHDFSSKDMERYLGGGILQQVPGTRVQLTKPEVEVRLEVEQDVVRFYGHKIIGLGGFPLPTQETVVSLLSGGYDSSVATYQFIRRGARTHFCFFNLGGAQHETGVRQTAYYLWQRYSRSHPLKFISIDFAPVVEAILTHVDAGQMGVVLKRQMLRAADKVAQNLNASALVTGEAMGQVSSQTLSNLKVIDQAAESLVLRPLITLDKQDIINQARAIGTEDFAKSMPEYCGVISQRPTVKAVPSVIAAEEAKLPEGLVAKVVRASNVEDIRDIGKQAAAQVPAIEVSSGLEGNHTIIDIRSSDEIESKPLPQADLHIPFFKLGTASQELDPNQSYLLYCEKGVMSKLQALFLQEQGFNNVGIYIPEKGTGQRA